MNLAFLGDALDHWKGSVFESLRLAGVVRDFAVDPMASDLASWLPTDFALFSKLLRIDRCRIVPHDYTLADRAAYFAEIQHSGDLFLDPDTGIATGKGAPAVQHVAPREIARLLDEPGRLLAVYQHVRAQRVCDRVDAVCEVVREVAPDCSWCSYESGTVAMIFFARAQERIVGVSEHFNEALGRHAAHRIRASEVSREV